MVYIVKTPQEYLFGGDKLKFGYPWEINMKLIHFFSKILQLQ
jgi:hypothetical protein